MTYPRRRLGTADVELMLSLVILLMTLFLAWGAGRVARLRLQVSDRAHISAVRDATVALHPADLSNSDVNPMGSDLVAPLPNHVNTGSAAGNLSLVQPNGKPLSAVALAAKSKTISPWWNYTDYVSYGPDQAATKTWYDNHVGDYHQPLESPFQLAPAWPP